MKEKISGRSEGRIPMGRMEKGYSRKKKGLGQLNSSRLD